MNNERFTSILDEILRVDKKVHFNDTKYDIDSFAGVFQTARNTRVVNNPLKVDEALLIMLRVTHSFKNLIDEYYNDDSDDDSVNINKEIENIINNRFSVVKTRPWSICLFRTKLTPYSGEIDPPFRIIDPLTVPGKRLPFRRN